MSRPVNRLLSADGLHRERCHQPEQYPASRQQCLATVVGVVDADMRSIVRHVVSIHVVKHLLVHGEDIPHLCRLVSVGGA